ncbi:MAG: DUF5050 domain-containing protein [Lachnospiraceae bacterium]|nr:DUF5050 domain-containing protein [Ruminococcus sp.]MCM1275859.1 DUF5050 domain-containing protein [Lachnospiraceae bacterium]
MLRHELKKLLIKQYGLLLFVILLLGEIVFLNVQYPENRPANAVTKQHLDEYMSNFSGKLTQKNEEKILVEQETILNAKNVESDIMRRLWYNEYESESDFLSELAPVSIVSERSGAFDILMSKYNYASKNPENRYIINYEYSGLTRDYPDIFITLLVILLTAFLFLNEENSNVITIIRISENGMRKTLRSKIASVSILICAAHGISVVAELMFMLFRGKADELLFPLQSIEFYRNCPFEISILGAFFALSAIRLLGYFFLAALIAMLSVTIKKPLLTVFIPTAVCVLQQFLFSPATPAYYLPTGLLRAVGYFRGNSEETRNSGTMIAETVPNFSEIPLTVFILIIAVSMIFIGFAVFLAARYYGGYRSEKHIKIPALIVSVMMMFSLSGCSSDKTENIAYNAGENLFFAQNGEYFFVSDDNGITAVSKASGVSHKLVTDAFKTSNMDCRVTVCGDYLYYCDRNPMDNSINRLSLSDMTSENLISSETDKGGFLGISLNHSGDLSEKMIDSFFTDGSNLYVTLDDDGIYQLSGNRFKCIISERLYKNTKVSFDGNKIYYINRRLELKSYDFKSGNTETISGSFTKAVYYDETRLLYSNSNGIFSLNTRDNSTDKLSDEIADELSSDGKSIVFSKNGALYLLGDKKQQILDYEPPCFAILGGTNMLFVRKSHNDDDYSIIKFNK